MHLANYSIPGYMCMHDIVYNVLKSTHNVVINCMNTPLQTISDHLHALQLVIITILV